MTNRISWIDIARGLGILFVIYAHALNSHSIRFFFYAFHMPLFFFVSGLVFHVKKHEGFWVFAKKSARNILLPYFIFAYISYALWYFTLNTTHFTHQDTINQLLHLLYGNGKDKYFIFNNVLWFLPCLFVVRIGFSSLVHVVHKRTVILVALVLLSIIGYFVAHYYPHLMLPFGAEIALNGMVFYGLGYLWQTQPEALLNRFQKQALWIFLGSLLICIVVASVCFSIYHLQIDMRMSRLNNFFYFYAGALSGIISCVAFSMFLKTNRVLEYLGRSTMVLFAWHLVLFSYFSHWLSFYFTDDTLQHWDNLLLSPLYTIAAIIIILVGAHFYRMGKQRLAPASASAILNEGNEKK